MSKCIKHKVVILPAVMEQWVIATTNIKASNDSQITITRADGGSVCLTVVSDNGERHTTTVEAKHWTTF